MILKTILATHDEEWMGILSRKKKKKKRIIMRIILFMDIYSFTSEYLSQTKWMKDGFCNLNRNKNEIDTHTEKHYKYSAKMNIEFEKKIAL